ncbi:MAG: phosphotransferase [Paracoccaceae bacterium]
MRRVLRGCDLRAAFAQWGVEVIRPLPGGHRNAVFLVERNGARLVTKTTRHSEVAMRWLIPVLQAAEQVGLKPPILFRDANGKLAPGGVTLEPFVDGEPARWLDVHALMPRVRRFHVVLRGWPQRPGILQHLTAPSSHHNALNRASDRLGPARTVVHGDVTPSNVILSERGLSLIDWDEARVDHPAHDTPQGLQSACEARARLCREVVSGWEAEPAYARLMARRLRAQRAPTG